MWQQLSEWIPQEQALELALDLVRALAVLAVGFILARATRAMLTRALANRSSAQQEMIAQRLVQVGVWVLTAIAALRQLGFDLSVLVGAAGILTVAVGFASKTAASNIISGMFLMGERPFVVGDVIRVGATTGEVNSIDLLSVKLRTFDNLLVRIPNESLLSSELTNLSHFPIRRYDLPLRLDYDTKLDEVRALLMRLADEHPLCFESPAPLFTFQALGESAVEVQFSVWTARANFVEVKNSLSEQIKLAFEAADIRVAHPQRVVTLARSDELPGEPKS